MSKREGIIALLICALIVAVAVWSRIRYADGEGYDEPLRWKADEYPAERLQGQADE